MKTILTLSFLSFLFMGCVAQTAPKSSAYESKMDSIDNEMEKVYNEYKTAMAEAQGKSLDPIVEKALEGRMDSLQKSKVDVFMEIVDKFKQTKIPAKYIKDMMWSLSYDQLAKVMDPASGYYNDAEMATPKKYFEGLSKRKPGSTVIDLSMPDMDGKRVKLTDWVGKGKYVLVDFWASWCGPCRQEMPNVVEAYKKYKGDKFEIVGVSFDNNAAAWKGAVKNLGMTWPQMSDLKGWQSQGASAYGIMSIPSNILFSPEGKVVALDLRGSDLSDKLAEVLK